MKPSRHTSHVTRHFLPSSSPIGRWTLDVGRWALAPKALFPLLSFLCSLLLSPHAFAQSVKVINPDTQPLPVKVLSNYTAPSVTSAPGSTPSPSPAMVVNIQGNASGIAVPVRDPVATTVKSTAFEASHVLKASAGSLGSLTVYNSNSSAQFILIMDSATVPANGAVTLLVPPIPIAGNTVLQLQFHFPLVAAAGISVCNSSTGTFTKTIGSADCAFTGQVF